MSYVLESEGKRLDEQAVEKTKEVEQGLRKSPPPLYQEFLALPRE
jgi:hypothetical protein